MLPDAYTGCDEAQPYQIGNRGDAAARAGGLGPAGHSQRAQDSRGDYARNAARAGHLPRASARHRGRGPGRRGGGLGNVGRGRHRAGWSSPGQDWPWMMAGHGKRGWASTTSPRLTSTSTADPRSNSTAARFPGRPRLRVVEALRVGANFTYDDRDYEGSLAGDEPGEDIPGQGQPGIHGRDVRPQLLLPDRPDQALHHDGPRLELRGHEYPDRSRRRSAAGGIRGTDTSATTSRTRRTSTGLPTRRVQASAIR